MTAVAEKRHRVEPVLTHQQMKKFKAEVRETILTLVNTYGVDYRLQADGQHLFLYSGKRGERPFKIAASRPVNAQMRFLEPWIKEHVPDYAAPTKERNVEAIFKCMQGCRDASFTSVEEINQHYAEEHPAETAGITAKTGEEARETALERGDRHAQVLKEVFANPKPKPPKRRPIEDVPVVWEEPPTQPEPLTSWSDGSNVEWAKYLYANGKESTVFEVTTDRSKPMVIRCTAPGCSFQRVDDFRGVHLHENKHTGKAAEYAAMGGEAVRKMAESRKPDPAHPKMTVRTSRVTDADGEAIYDALETLARAQGYVVVTAAMAEDIGKAEDDAQMIMALRDEVARLEDEKDALRKELDETKAKLALIREAMSL